MLSAPWPILVVRLDHHWWFCSRICNSCFSTF
jgi:hypothetical protein